MYLKIGVHPEAISYNIINLDTGQRIDNVFEADDETGFYRYHPINEKGSVYLDPCNLKEIKKRTARGNIKLFKAGDLPWKEETSFGKKKDSFSDLDIAANIIYPSQT